MNVLAVVPLVGIVACSDAQIGATKEQKELAVSPSLVDVGDVSLGESAVGTVTVTSIQGDVQVTNIEVLGIAGDFFTAPPDPFVVARGDSAQVQVTYTPGGAGWHTSQLALYTDEGDDVVHVVDLRGHAGAASLVVDPWLVDFGAVVVGGAAAASVALHNVGDIPLTVDALALDDPDFTSTFVVPQVVAAGGDADVPLRFAPTDDAPALASLTLSIVGVDAPVVTLRGNACDDGDPAVYDADHDGWTSCAGDCDDGDATAHDGAPEVCDGVDDDCDGAVDDGTICGDDDGDGYTEEGGDCADARADVHPGQEEILGNGIDDDCDGVVDQGTDDADGDGFTIDAGDCDDTDKSRYPGNTEVVDDVDNDCDGVADEGTIAYDDDGDGESEIDGDCADDDAAIHSGADEVGNGIDDDCDGSLDEGTSWSDDDGDGWSDRGGDCDDTDAATNPGALESSGDGLDNDCDGVTL